MIRRNFMVNCYIFLDTHTIPHFTSPLYPRSLYFQLPWVQIVMTQWALYCETSSFQVKWRLSFYALSNLSFPCLTCFVSVSPSEEDTVTHHIANVCRKAGKFLPAAFQKGYDDKRCCFYLFPGCQAPDLASRQQHWIPGKAMSRHFYPHPCLRWFSALAVCFASL